MESWVEGAVQAVGKGWVQTMLLAWFLCQAKLEERVRVLRELAASCTERELAILASAVEMLSVSYDVDAMRELVIIQVDRC